MMKKIVIVTDSSSGISQAEAQSMGVVVVPIPFTINGEEYLEDISITADKFFALLAQDATVNTSQPAKYYLEELWTKLLQEYETVIYIPITSGLSGSCANATAYAEKFNGRVLVIDNLRISAPLKISVYEAVKMAERGKSAAEIKAYLEATKHKFSIYITLSTLKNLRKGGRITPAAAILGDMLRLKPILYTRGQNFDKYAVALSMSQAKKKMMAKIKSELTTEFKTEYAQGKMALLVAHTKMADEALQFKAEIEREFPHMKVLYTDPLCLCIACHTGIGALGMGICVCDYL